MSIANPARGEYAINLDKSRILRYDLNAFIHFEESTGKSIEQAFGGDTDPSLKDVRALIWAGLVHEDRALTLEQAGDMIQYGVGDSIADKMQWLIEECTQAVQVSFPVAASKKKAKSRKA